MSMKKGLWHIPFSFDSFGSLVRVHPPVQVCTLIDRFMFEDYACGISVHIIERVRFLPPLHFHIIK